MSEASQPGPIVNVSLSGIGKFAKPAQTVAQVFADVLKEYVDIQKPVWREKAKVSKRLAAAKGAEKLATLEERAIARRKTEENRQQANIEAIAGKSLSFLNEDARPAELDPDWISSFFEKARQTSDQDMQMLWARILAGEACRPGAFSKRTLSIVADIDKKIADHFVNLVSLALHINGELVVVIPTDEEGPNPWFDFGASTYLEALGLICMSVSGYREYPLPPEIQVSNANHSVILRFLASDGSIKQSKLNHLSNGPIILTPFGTELARICEAIPREGHLDEVLAFWRYEHKGKLSIVNEASTPQAVLSEGSSQASV